MTKPITPAAYKAATQLEAAAAAYRAAQEKADAIMATARTKLAASVCSAYASGVRKVDIGRITDKVWSRAWIDETIRKGTESAE